MKLLKSLVVLSGSILLSACASMSKEECLVADWYTIGLEDGSAGQTTAAIGKHRKACAKAGVTPNLQQYQAGHKQGLKNYCTRPKGFSAGAAGQRYNGVCQGPLEKNFLWGYDDGRLLYNAKTAVNSLNKKVDNLYNHIEQVKHDLTHYEAEVISNEATPKERYDGLAAIKDLTRELEELETEVVEIEHLRDEKQDEYEQLNRKYSNMGY